MSTFTETITLDLGPAYAGATLRAQWYNVATGADEGSAISAGFVEIGGGRYDFTDEFTLAAGERQGVKFYEDGTPGTILARSIVSQLATSTPFTETIPLDLGGAYAGILADLRAQWYDETTGTDVGAAISAGFIEIGGGMYDFTDEFDLEDGESQGVKFYDIGDPATILARSVVTGEFAQAPASVIVSASTLRPRYAVRDLPPIAQGSEHQDQFTITNLVTGDAVDLSGKTLRFVVCSVEDEDTEEAYDDTLTAEFKYETGGGGITVGGDDSNVVTIQHDADKTATPGRYRYFLWDTTDTVVLVKGRLTIEPAEVNV